MSPLVVKGTVSFSDGKLSFALSKLEGKKIFLLMRYDVDFLSIPFACSHFISSKAHCLVHQELLQTRFAQTSKSSRIHFGNFAKNLAKALTSLTWIAQKINIFVNRAYY
jgi:hypothetical protein